MPTFINANIFLGLDTSSFATAMTVTNGQITWIGNTNTVSDPTAIDLRGQTVLPGLIDVHTHPKYIADALHGVACTPPNVNSIAEMKTALRQSPQFGKGEKVWIEGWGFDETKLAEHRTPTINDLDDVSTTQPIFIYRSDCHSSVGNSKALELAGISRDTSDPKGGFIGHFADGRPNGYMKEVAASQLLIRAKSVQSFAGDVENMVASSNHYLANGIVAIGEMMGRKKPTDSLELYQAAVEAGFKPKTAIYYVYDEVAEDKALQPTSEEQLRIAGIKVFMDGSISGETADNQVTYLNGQTGVAITNAAKLHQAVDYARQHHLQVAVHAMGDAAIQLVLDVTRELTPWLADRPSIRIEHASILSDQMLHQINEATMTYALVTQPIFFFAEDESYRQYLSPAQFKLIYRDRSMLASKAAFALSSDAPCTPWAEPDSPFVNIYAAVTRKAANGDLVNPAESISVPEAVLAYTNWPAKIGGFKHNGTLQPGMAADFIILDRNIFSIPAEELKDVRVKETWLNGRKVFG